ncbi:MAG: GntR family transcriptional regulator/MocR family aminotransferase [Myxococcota bacterium]|jgi:GntR family transcriptional regulator/MocR family aminotransferase
MPAVRAWIVVVSWVVLAPGLRLGFVVAAPAIIEHLLSHRIALDRQGDLAMECAVADLIEDGTFQRHLRRARRLYRSRRDHLASLLTATFPDTLHFSLPPGGLALWAHAPGIDVSAWQDRGYREGVALRAGTAYRLDGSASEHLRLGFVRLDEDELTEGVARMKRAIT